jgi:hypothetical protein
VQELLADEVAFLPGKRDEPDDLIGNPLLLLERERDGLRCGAEIASRPLDPGDRHGQVGVEQELDDHHRVVSLFDGLAIERRGELRE